MAIVLLISDCCNDSKRRETGQTSLHLGKTLVLAYISVLQNNPNRNMHVC